MSVVYVSLKKQGIDVELMSEECLAEMTKNDEVNKKIGHLAMKFSLMMVQEVEKMDLNGRQKIMMDILVINRIKDATQNALYEMYKAGALKKREKQM